ncbi:4-hydroxy-3-methylbut-2-enyl diphosphate reductase [Coriobacteriia bacterium Es71-Z0120]|uniref:4-hydroxy-3-methylbut-2-enyl diphosphate reductase n=1 Tax=Parvivirga hydrogeniphila TaxID=2939460 RepID=UPI0022609AA1|nr:4-hydroxy-3-methylbut-2-enyl diphosphate reductase [Parvivirga hydrogeniphila]MCL4079057.1 4-hydroxy-3-methylbut-2-enyl diphosphate reductase [Parvivirga hydrogeniphila]
MKVIVAEHAGVCYGVERALRLAHEAAATGAAVHTLGPLIHNPQAVEELKTMGVEVADGVEDIASGTVVVRSHGVPPAVIARAEERGLRVVDATCPFVSTAQRHAADLAEHGYTVVIVGEADHPEVEGIVAHAGGEAIVVEDARSLPERLPSKRVGVVVQTTQTAQRLEDVVCALLPRTSELRVFNTICSATTKRQKAARELARTVDAMVVVGGHNSGNTTRLAEICREENPNVHHIETPEEIDPAWFDRARVVGVTAGASTPSDQIDRIVDAIERMGDA